MHLYQSTHLEKLYNFGFSRGGPRWPPRHGYGAPLALKQGLDFSKAPLRGAVFLLPWVRAKKKARPRAKKWGRTRVRTRFFAHFRLIFLANLPEGLIQIFPFYLTTRKWQDRSGHHGYHLTQGRCV